MSANIVPTHQVEQYNNNLELLVQQKGSRFRGTMREETATGAQMSPVDQIGVIEASEVTARFAPLVRTDAPTDRRWCLPRDFHVTQMVDAFDKLRVLNQPEGALTQSAVYALGRKMDDIIVDAFFGTALTGTRGGTSTTVLSANTVAVNFRASTDIGLSCAKIIRAKTILLGNEVDLLSDTLYIAVDANQHEKLLSEMPIISREFNSSPALDGDGMITRWLGFRFIFSQRLDVDSNADKLIPAWAKSGMAFVTWNALYTDVTQRKDLSSQPWQVYNKATFGATRVEEKKVVQIICDPATT